jgi:hypothetical protein
MKKKLDFQAKISDVETLNPNFSVCKIRVLYTGRNRNMTLITKEAVEKALPTLLNIPIVGEFSQEKGDFKGHGGAIDMDSFDFIHTTKAYGVVPTDATYEWETVGGREYLTISGCLLWTGRYPEAYSVIENGKGQSMEIEVTDGWWNEKEDAYQIDSYIYSALCILGDDVEPAFEDASVSKYAKKEDIQQEIQTMLSEYTKSLNSKEGEQMDTLKKLLEKYSLTVEDLTAKGIDFNEVSEDELEAKIIEVFEIQADGDTPEDEDSQEPSAGTDPEGDNAPEGDDEQADGDEPEAGQEPEGSNDPEGATAQSGEEGDNPEGDNPEGSEEPVVSAEEYENLKNRIAKLENDLSEKDSELETLREFKLNAEKKEHESKVQAIFNNFQLAGEDIESIDIHTFSVEEIEEKCYAILGRKLASKKQFSKNKDTGIHLPINGNENKDDKDKLPYGGLIDDFLNKNKK